MTLRAAVVGVLLLAAAPAPESFVGHSEAELVKRLGIPFRVQDNGVQRFLEYDDLDWYFLRGARPRIADFECHTIFVVTGGRVVAAHRGGNDC